LKSFRTKISISLGEKMKVCLIQPNSRVMRGTTAPPLGLMFVAGTCREAGHEVKIIDRNIEYFSIKKIKEYKPDIVGISAFTGPLLLDVIKISKKIKEMFGDDFPIILGGIHPSLLPEQTLENPYIDYVVRGEGEYTFLELIETIKNIGDLSKVKGIGYKENGNIILTEDRPFIKNLDELPMMPWDLVKAKKYFRLEITLVTSRGCPHNCAFCYNNDFNKGTWRGWGADRVLKEIKVIEKYTKNRYLKFHEDNFTVNKKRLYPLLDGLSSDYSLYIETRVGYVNEGFLSHLEKFKNVWLFFGVESGSQRLLNYIDKGTTLDQIENAFRLCNQKDNINTTASVILGLPTQTKEDVDITLAMLTKIKPTRYTFCLFTPYPGSPLYQELVQNGTFKPPKSMEEWANFSPDITDINFSEVDPKYIRKLHKWAWRKTILNIIKAKHFHKIIQRILDFDPYIMRFFDYFDERVTK
jgi:radical SAM superfamily enzyme YgiQ (UPF0313 family)